MIRLISIRREAIANYRKVHMEHIQTISRENGAIFTGQLSEAASQAQHDSFFAGQGEREGGGYYFWRLKSSTLPPCNGEPPLAKSRSVTAPPSVCGSSNIQRRRGRNRSSHQISNGKSTGESLPVVFILYISFILTFGYFMDGLGSG